MATLNRRIKLYLTNNSKVYEQEKNNYVIQNDSDGNGYYLKSWNVSGLAEPTESQLNSLDNQADINQRNEVVRRTRRISYGLVKDQLDEIYKDIDAWKARIQSIKDANPKE